MATGISPLRGFLLDLVTQERIDFQFNPEEFPLKLGADWSAKSPRGASHPRRHFAAGKGRTFSLTLQIVRATDDASDVTDLARKLEALVAPDYDRSGRLANGPHPVRVVLGSWRTLRCLVDDVDITSGPAADAHTLVPFEFVAHVSFVEAPEKGDLSHDDIRGGQ